MSEADPWADAMMAAALLALDPGGVGGVALRAPAGAVRARWLGVLEGLVGRCRKLPASIAEDRLLGGLDLAATLAAGAARFMPGALVGADGGIVLLAMAERVPAATAARVAQALDTGMVGDAAARFGVVLLDEGIDEERAPAVLLERVAMQVDLTAIPLLPVVEFDLEAAQGLYGAVEVDDAGVEACARRR